MRSKLFAGGLAVTVAFLLATNPVVSEAAGQITGKQIKNSSVTGKDIKDATLTGSDVTDGSLRGADLADGSLAAGDLADGSVTGAKIADGSVSTTDVADGSLKASDFAAGELPYTRAYQFSDSTSVAVGTSATVVGTLALTQPGTYVVTSKARFNSGNANESFIDCDLTDGVVTDRVESGFGEDAGEDDYRTVGSLLATTVAGPATITWTCYVTNGASMSADQRRIVAVKVASLN